MNVSDSELVAEMDSMSPAPLLNRKFLTQNVVDTLQDNGSQCSESDNDPTGLTGKVEEKVEPKIVRRWRIRRASQRVLCGALPEKSWPRVVRCGWSMGALVRLLGQEGNTSWTGVEHCNSIWACPLCASRIREGRRLEIQEGFNAAQKLGWKAWFVTFTVPHTIKTPLSKSLGAMRSAWAKMRRYSSLKSFWSGVEGVIKSTEVQVGSHGFHPHFHCIFFTHGSIDESKLKAAWAKAIVKEGLARPSDKFGVYTKEATSVGISRYLSKVQEEKVSFEMSRSDLKQGRKKAAEWHCSPFDLLDKEVELPIDMPQRQKLWVEFFKATKSVSAIRWSKGLKEKLFVEEVEDEKLGALSPEEADAQLQIVRKEYRWLFAKKPSLLAKAQQLFAEQRYEAVASLGIGKLILPGIITETETEEEDDWLSDEY